MWQTVLAMLLSLPPQAPEPPQAPPPQAPPVADCLCFPCRCNGCCCGDRCYPPPPDVSKLKPYVAPPRKLVLIRSEWRAGVLHEFYAFEGAAPAVSFSLAPAVVMQSC